MDHTTQQLRETKSYARFGYRGAFPISVPRKDRKSGGKSHRWEIVWDFTGGWLGSIVPLCHSTGQNEIRHETDRKTARILLKAIDGKTLGMCNPKRFEGCQN